MPILTIDVGSSSLRADLFDNQANSLGAFETQLKYDVRPVDIDGVEIDGDSLAERLFSAIDQTLKKAGDLASSIEGVGFCSLVSNVLGIDKDGKPTTPIYTWADTRCAPQAEALRSKLDEAEVHERTGCRIHTSYLPARLLWLRAEMPEAFARTATWISLGEYIHLLILGRYSQSLSTASWSGLLNRHTLDWDDWLLDQIEIKRENLPPLVDAYDGIHGLKPEFAERWPALKNAIWFPCVGDGVTSNLGSGCYTSGDWAVQVGTSGAMRALVPDSAVSGTKNTQSASQGKAFNTTHSKIQIPMGLWCYHLDRSTALLGGALSEGGNVFAWLLANLHVADLNSVEQEAAMIAPDSHGLTVLPFIAGERSPDWNPSARMLISGISLATRPADILRAAQEAIIYRFASVFDILGGALPAPTRIVASGGALLKTPGLMHMLADALNSPVTESSEAEASSKGAAMIALRGLGHIQDYSSIPAAFGTIFQPDKSRNAIYHKAMARQQELYERISS